ncbi:MAG: glycosyltransferase family 2 protein [Candidatus Zhuqueibacterota bacterium]
MMSPELSIIIVNWNTRDLLKECVQSIYKETKGISYEIFVVDNASADGSAALIERQFPDVRLIRNEENLGYGRASNQALKFYQGEYVLFLNPDTQIQRNAIVTLVNFMKENPGVGMTGPKTIHPDGTIQVSWAKFPCLSTVFTNNVSLNTAVSIFGVFGKLLKNNVRYTDSGLSVTDVTHCMKVDYLLGEFLLTKKSILETVGGFPDDIFMYEEETDLCYRIHQQGWEIWFVPDAQIIHHEKKSIRQIPNHIEKEVDWFIAGRSRFYRKYYGKVKLVFFHVFNFVNSLCKLAMYCVMDVVSLKKRTFVAEKFKWQWEVIVWYYRKLNSINIELR